MFMLVPVKGTWHVVAFVLGISRAKGVLVPVKEVWSLYLLVPVKEAHVFFAC